MFFLSALAVADVNQMGAWHLSTSVLEYKEDPILPLLSEIR